jgi:hypothetical protein
MLKEASVAKLLHGGTEENYEKILAQSVSRTRSEPWTFPIRVRSLTSWDELLGMYLWRCGKATGNCRQRVTPKRRKSCARTNGIVTATLFRFWIPWRSGEDVGIYLQDHTVSQSRNTRIRTITAVETSKRIYTLYRPSDRRLSAKVVPTFADRMCCVVSATDPHGR